jgi:RimJ/RimL family protein N-acetyltransferase
VHPSAQPYPVDVPSGYPRDFERAVRLRDGRTAHVRPIIPADGPRLADAIRSADADTLRRRFLGGPPHVTPDLLTRLSTVDYDRRFALVAEDAAAGEGVAVARYDTIADGVAEVAVVVDPAWRRVGLATTLVEMLAEAALSHGIHTITALYLAENRPVTALLGLAGEAGHQVIQQGFAEFAVALDRQGLAAARDLTAGGQDSP